MLKEEDIQALYRLAEVNKVRIELLLFVWLMSDYYGNLLQPLKLLVSGKPSRQRAKKLKNTQLLPIKMKNNYCSTILIPFN